METKKILITLFIAISITTAFAQKSVTISGQLIHFSNQVLVEDMSEYQYLRSPTPDRIIIPDSTGKFEITFTLGSPNYFRIGRNILYLTPDDKLTTTIDKDNPTKSEFRGIGAAANNYLVNTPFPKGGSFLEAGKNLKPTPAETLQIILDEANKRSQQLAAVTQVSPEFIRLEQARIKADVLCSFAAVTSYAKFSKKLASPDDYIKAFNTLAAPMKTQYEKGFIDASLLKLVVYRDLAEDMVKDFATSASTQPIVDYYKTNNKLDKASRERDNSKIAVNQQFFAELINVQKIKDYYTASELIEKMSRESEKAKLVNYSKSVDSIHTLGYREALKEYLKNLLAFGKGDLAADFTAIDISGRKVSLISLKGKIIYVDMWATWCGPCLAEMPRLEEIKTKYKDNSNIVFLSLSIDDDNQVDNWKKNVASRKADGYQWQINRNKLSAYNVTTIPRTLLIGKDFKIVSMSAPLPSAKELTMVIDKLLTN